jgi:MFS family permease
MLQADTVKILALRVLWSSILLQSVMVPFFVWKGLSFSEILFVQSSFSLMLLALELPTGYVGDLVGRRAMLILAAAARASAGAAFVVLEGFWGMMIAYAFVAISITAFSGTDIAALYESLQGEKPGSRKRDRNLAAFYWLPYIASSVSALIGGAVYGLSVELAVALNFVATAATVPIALSIGRGRLPDQPGAGTGNRQILHGRIAEYLRKRSVVGAVVSAAAFTLPFSATIYTFQALWLAGSFSPAAMGLVFAMGGAVSALAAFFYGRVARLLGARRVYLACIALIVAGLLLPLAGSPVASVLGMLMILAAEGAMAVFHAGLVNAAIGNEVRASINSVIGFLSKLLAAATVFAAAKAVAANVTGEFPFLLTVGVFLVFVLSSARSVLALIAPGEREQRLAS